MGRGVLEATQPRRAPAENRRTQPDVAVVVPHTHWDREWYAPFETMRFHLVQFFDELVATLEQEPRLPAFLLDGQAVILEDYLEVRRDQQDRVAALVAAGRLRPGPFYVQPDEFHISGEALVRNLLIGCQVSRRFGWVMREGYLPDTFGHVHQLPQILRGFGIETFYAMRGFDLNVDETGSEFWWEAPDGSRVLVEWLTESYSNAAVLAEDPLQMALHHGVLVGYSSLPELLDRLGSRSRTGVLLLLNGGDHLRVQSGVPELAGSLRVRTRADLRLGGLEEFHQLVAERALPEFVVRGELRYGIRHDVFDGIGSTRTPLKRLNEQTEGYLTGVAERLDGLATLVDGRSSVDSLRYAWRELLKNYAHDSICGCSVDAVHEEMAVRFAKVGQVARAVAEDALARLAVAAAPVDLEEAVTVVVVNPSAFARTAIVTVDVLPDLNAPLGQRRFGWAQAPGVDWSDYRLLDIRGRVIPFTTVGAQEVTVADALNRRKELLRDRISFTAVNVPPLGTAVYRLVPLSVAAADRVDAGHLSVTTRTARALHNDRLRVEVETAGTLAVTDTRTGRTFDGLFELLDDGDAGDTYGFGPLARATTLSSRASQWLVEPGDDAHSLVVRGALTVPECLVPERTARSTRSVDLPTTFTVRLDPGADRVEVDVTVDNRARDHRLRLCLPTGAGSAGSLAESAYGVIRRDGALPKSDGWRERPSGVFALRRFVAIEDGPVGLQVLTEGLHEYTCQTNGVLEVTLLRAVGWMARMDHPLRPHKVGPELRTPGAQCQGEHTFRLAIRPYATGGPVGDLYQAAETFSVPLQACAVQSRQRPTPERAGPVLGLSIMPTDVVLSAVKTAEDRDGIIIRVFNAAAAPVTATLLPRFLLDAAQRCDLEEKDEQPLEIGPQGDIKVPLAAGQIATVRLHPAAPEGRGDGS